MEKFAILTWVFPCVSAAFAMTFVHYTIKHALKRTEKNAKYMHYSLFATAATSGVVILQKAFI